MSIKLKDCPFLGQPFLILFELSFFICDSPFIPDAASKEKVQGLVEWANAFKAQDWDSVRQIDNKGVKEAMKTMGMIMGTPSERDILWKRRIAELDRRSLISDAIAEGKAERRAEAE